MNKDIFDERQKLNQYKYGAHSFSILGFAVMIFAVIKYYYPNLINSITPINEAMILIFIPGVYYLISTILTSSYCSFSNNKKLNITVLLDIILTLIIFIVILFFKNGFADIAERKFLSEYMTVLLVAIELLIATITYIIRFTMDKKFSKNHVAS